MLSLGWELDVLPTDAGCRPQCSLGCRNQRYHPIGLAQVAIDFFPAILDSFKGRSYLSSQVGSSHETRIADGSVSGRSRSIRGKVTESVSPVYWTEPAK